jgi:SH3-like domain-containing protein
MSHPLTKIGRAPRCLVGLLRLAGLFRLVSVLCVVSLAAITLATSGPQANAADPGSGLPVPRFVSLRSDKVNVRSGPGARYPVEWVFERRGMPVEVVSEYELWRKVRDVQGTEGWVHQNLLSSRRGIIVTGKLRALKADARDDAALVARVEPDVVGQLLQCKGGWCRVDVDGYRGWLKRGEIWGVFPTETVE